MLVYLQNKGQEAWISYVSCARVVSRLKFLNFAALNDIGDVSATTVTRDSSFCGSSEAPP